MNPIVLTGMGVLLLLLGIGAAVLAAAPVATWLAQVPVLQQFVLTGDSCGGCTVPSSLSGLMLIISVGMLFGVGMSLWGVISGLVGTRRSVRDRG